MLEKLKKLKSDLLDARMAKEVEQDKVILLRRQCTHHLSPLTPSQRGEEWMCIRAHCEVCEASFGWRCKESPDSVCHYFTDDGKIELIDGTEIIAPKGHDFEWETEDCCIFCGDPDERD